MNSMLAAETAVLVHFQSVRIVLFVLERVVVALFAFRASQGDFYSHLRHLLIWIFLPPSFLAEGPAVCRVRALFAHKKRTLLKEV